MAKQSGLGDNFYVDGIDVSNDTGQLQAIGTPRTSGLITGIDKYAIERKLLKRDGRIAATCHWNPVGAQLAFRSLPTIDRNFSYFRGAAIGSPCASMVAKQINWDGTREADGLFPFAVEAVANGYGLEWGDQLTAGKRTDGTATNGASLDGAASSAFGGQGFVHLFAFTGTSVTIKIQDSADNAAWADLTGGSFGALNAVGSVRIETARNQTVRRYLRVATTGTFSNAVFAVHFARNAFTVNF